jgi:hypothetical protein
MKQDKISKTLNNISAQDKEPEKTEGGKTIKSEQSVGKDNLQADALYQFLKPLHNLPVGKNAWNPQFIRQWWFWPVSAIFLIILFYVYPYIWDFFAG